MSFRENLKDELVFQGILVKELAAKTGISKRTLDNYLRENGNMPPVDVALKISEALNVSVEYLVKGKTVGCQCDDSATFSSEIKKIALKISSLDCNGKKLVKVLVDELCNQQCS